MRPRHYIRQRKQQPAQPQSQVEVLPNRLLDAREAAEMLGVSKTTLYALALRGDGPPSCKIGARRLWGLHAIQSYIARLEEEARSERTTTWRA